MNFFAVPFLWSHMLQLQDPLGMNLWVNHHKTAKSLTSYRKSSINPPPQPKISSLPLISPPFQGKKVSSPASVKPPPSPALIILH